MERWTISQLNKLSDLRFAQAILIERMNRLTQPYSPLASKLRCAAAKLNELATEEEERAMPKTKVRQYTSFDEVFEALKWTCYKCSDGTLELENHSPAGEDLIFSIDGKDIPVEVRDYAEDFDKDEHVEFLVGGRGKRGAPETVRELLEDAEAIQKMLDELAEALESVHTNCDLGTYDCATCAIHGNCGREEEGDDDDAREAVETW